ncbi:polysaccharide deacetylase [Sphingobacterium sp. SRCM116780]|uniref:polysaccharide deacetylase family protein n=1 Tax=Sphingobacterium sp. SRCM116780 TaxID=2907623 RepID=UPI001F252B78|nr:polysaccharide deacetylase [Sphingobacterium sp. SRCM116780]UIR56414.1 polysaccharide deacetylase [Sphingobacterium sp. SRCM116780]
MEQKWLNSIFKYIGLIILFMLIKPGAIYSQCYEHIVNYQVHFTALSYKGQQYIGIRSFRNDGQDYVLSVNPNTLDTYVMKSTDCKIVAVSNIQKIGYFSPSVYSKSFKRVRNNEGVLQDAGIDFAFPKEMGINLTIDLCPSHKPLDKVVFESLFSAFKGVESSLPVAISLSGKWILNHEADLHWLLDQKNKGLLTITWINHTYNHKVNKDPLNHNFLLAEGTDVTNEILANEMLMLKKGIVPSVFFRFPGLVSSKKIIEEVLGFGLIPVGSDAWLAKGQHVKDGSIVLIHANGNEEVGIQDFIQLLKSEQKNIKSKHWILHDLHEGFEY